MLIFIDESGDAGMKLKSGSSAHVCIMAIGFDNAFDANACDRQIELLRWRLNKRSDDMVCRRCR